MNIFSNKQKLIYKVKIFMKSGNVIEAWFSKFEKTGEILNYAPSISYSKFLELKELSKEALRINVSFDYYFKNDFLSNLLDTKLIDIEYDQIECIQQIDVKIINEFEDEFINKLNNKIEGLK